MRGAERPWGSAAAGGGDAVVTASCFPALELQTSGAILLRPQTSRTVETKVPRVASPTAAVAAEARRPGLGAYGLPQLWLVLARPRSAWLPG